MHSRLFRRIARIAVSIKSRLRISLKQFILLFSVFFLLIVTFVTANYAIKHIENPLSKAADILLLPSPVPVTLTRAQIAVRLTGEFGLTLINPSTPTFADVAITSPYYQAVETFAGKGITTGCAVNPMRYCPDRIVTRAEAITFLVRLFNQKIIIDSGTTSYSDIAGHPLEKYIKFADQIGLSQPCSKGSNYFCPDDPVMTDQLQVFLNKGYFIIPKKPMRWIQPNFHPDKKTIWETALEYPEMWDNTFKNIDVFGLFIYSIHSNPLGYLDKVAAVVKKYNLKTNVELSGLMMTTSCGDQKAEESAALTLKLIQPLYDKGIKVDYISLDGSGTGGMGFNGCESMPPDLRTREFIQYLQLVHAGRPEIKFGLLPNFEWWAYKEIPNYWNNGAQDYAKVLDDLVSSVESAGEKIHFVLVDDPYEYAMGTVPTSVSGLYDWMRRIVRLENQVEKKGMMFGLIYNSSGGTVSDKAFYDDAMAYKVKYQEKGGTPGIMMLESWSIYPITFVPDYLKYTFTNLAANFFQFPTTTTTRSLTRADAAVETTKLFRMDLVNPSIPTFSDVAMSMPYFRQVETFNAKKITTGCAANPLRYCPDRGLTRGEAVTFLLRAGGIPITIKNSISFSDVTSSYPLYNYVIFSAENGITSGCNPGAGKFCPDEVITLGEWENIAARVLNLYHSLKTCPLVDRCSTMYNGKTTSYIPDHRNGCYDFRLFPVYPLVGYAKSCPGSASSVCSIDKPCCTVQLGLDGKTCQ